MALEKEPAKIFGSEEGKLLALRKYQESRRIKMKEKRGDFRTICRQGATKTTGEILVEMPI